MRPTSPSHFFAIHVRPLAPRIRLEGLEDLARLAGRAGLCASLALAIGVTVATPRTAHAQASGVSDADRAAARELYIEAVKLQEQGKFEPALERFQRAQSVFSAPTHLLHIAECQAAMGRLVESAETYRTLVRTPLPAGSPAAFTQAQQQGGAELTQVEPRIPTLKLQVKPDTARNLTVLIDGQPMSAALVGVPRPIDPGTHTLSVSAAGFTRTEQQVTVKEKEVKELTMTLPSSGVVYGPAPTPTTPPATRPPQTTPPSAAPMAPPPAPYGAPPAAGDRAGEKDRGVAPAPAVYEVSTGGRRRDARSGFMLGPRVGFAIPGGNLETGVPSSNAVGLGGDVGIEGGLRFARVLYVGAQLDHSFFSKGSGVDDLLTSVPAGTVVGTSGASNYFGIDFAYISNPDGFGFYGEIGVGYRWLSLDLTETAGDGSGSAEVTQAYRGAEGSIGVGLHFRAADWLRLVPKVTLTAGTYTKFDESCTSTGTLTCARTNTTDADIVATETHSVVFVGMTGFFDLSRRSP